MIKAVDPAAIPLHEKGRGRQYGELIREFLLNGESAAEVSLQNVPHDTLYSGLYTYIHRWHYDVIVRKHYDKIYLMRKRTAGAGTTERSE